MILIDNKYNKFDRYLFLLIATLASGGIGGSLQISRVLAVLFLPALLSQKSQCRYFTNDLFNFIVLFCMFATFSLLWSEARNEGFKFVLYFYIHFILFAEIIVFARFANNPLKTISWAWVTFVCLCSVISIWEICTDNHLAMSRDSSDLTRNIGDNIIFHQRFTSVTFHNFNNYVTVLCYALPWVFYRLAETTKIKHKLVCLYAILCSFIFIMYNASRGGTLVFVIYAIIYIIFTPNSRGKYISIILFLAVLLFYISQADSSLFTLILSRSGSFTDYHDESRFSIWMVAIEAVLQTTGLGVGAGGTVLAMERINPGGINIPHNIILEIAIQYGVVFAVIFVLYLFRQMLKTLFVKDKYIKMALLMAFGGMPVFFIINSSYLQATTLYPFMATMFILVNYNKIKQQI